MASSGANAQQATAGLMESFAQHLNDGALDDKGVPNGQQGIPSNPAQVLQSVANNPAAAKGIPEDGPSGSQPHSLTPDYWDRSDQLIAKAAQSAALAGHDPNQVSQSLEAMRTSFIQSHFLRNLASANVASMSNTPESQAALEQSLHNAYYYLPDGKNLKLSRGDDGKLQYQDPFHPTGADGKPNMVPVTPEHIQLLGQAALNPMNFAAALQQYRMAPINAQIAQQEANAKTLTATGEYKRGAGIEAGGQARLGEVASTNVKNLSQAQLDQAKAQSSQWALKFLNGMKLDPTAERAVLATTQLTDSMFLGPPKQVPDVDGQGSPNMSPAAGKVIHDSSRVPKEFQNASAPDLAQVKGWAAGLVAANPRAMTPQQAVSIAGHAYSQAKATHPGPDGKPVHDVMVDQTTHTMHVWDTQSKRWNNFPMADGTATPLGSVPSSIFQMASGGLGGAIPPQGSSNSADTALDNGLAGGQ